MNELITANNQLSRGYLITCQQFIDDDFEGKVARNECEVFYYFEPPSEDASEDDKALYAYTTSKYGNVDSIASVEDVGDGYYFAKTKPKPGIGTLGLDANQQLLVWPAEVS